MAKDEYFIWYNCLKVLIAMKKKWGKHQQLCILIWSSRYFRQPINGSASTTCMFTLKIYYNNWLHWNFFNGASIKLKIKVCSFLIIFRWTCGFCVKRQNSWWKLLFKPKGHYPSTNNLYNGAPIIILLWRLCSKYFNLLM